ncbi:MAG TPA: hypothetical protein VK765_01465 [Solirubrobacteraceae bacterium]|jgi:hypothetical protein|nr:hypothetical protein [Solirubrobacteraceae bacterium]
MPSHDRLDLARVLLARAVDDETLVRKVCLDAELSEADVLSPWAVEFRYEGEEPPALDRSAALVLVAQLRTWTEREIKTADQPPNPDQRQPDENQPE